MAATVRLTDVAVAAVGEFGHAVQSRLLADGASALDPDRPRPGAAQAMVLVSWRPDAARTELFDELAHDRAIAWLPVVVDHPFLVVGPWVAPGGPCYDCYRFRREQHDPKSRHRAELLAAYRADDTLGVYGHLPHHLRAAEALARLVLQSPQPGMTVMVDLATMMVSRVDLIARHGCPRCGAADTWGDPRLAATIAETARQVSKGASV
ncbi:TOMM precursor leader peptide-binding protein [Catellatospora sichuanensis]|uniref:TOMM precursor leader peptide-binding protein n=1 Tax=Catellatospora sichuanensis TaxID=1969805 RepID=UPI001184361B|nr:TOMM precursor leader peptide-binding protein [Catellatospora sichuanensis]